MHSRCISCSFLLFKGGGRKGDVLRGKDLKPKKMNNSDCKPARGDSVLAPGDDITRAGQKTESERTEPASVR